MHKLRQKRTGLLNASHQRKNQEGGKIHIFNNHVLGEQIKPIPILNNTQSPDTKNISSSGGGLNTALEGLKIGRNKNTGKRKNITFNF